MVDSPILKALAGSQEALTLDPRLAKVLAGELLSLCAGKLQVGNDHDAGDADARARTPEIASILETLSALGQATRAG